MLVRVCVPVLLLLLLLLVLVMPRLFCSRELFIGTFGHGGLYVFVLLCVCAFLCCCCCTWLLSSDGVPAGVFSSTQGMLLLLLLRCSCSFGCSCCHCCCCRRKSQSLDWGLSFSERSELWGSCPWSAKVWYRACISDPNHQKAQHRSRELFRVIFGRKLILWPTGVAHE